MRRHRIVFWMLIGMSFVSMLMSIYCFIQVPIIKTPTQLLIQNLRTNVVISSQLGSGGKEEFDKALQRISGQNLAFERSHGALWRAGILGFGSLWLFSFLIAMLVPNPKEQPSLWSESASRPPAD